MLTRNYFIAWVNGWSERKVLMFIICLVVWIWVWGGILSRLLVYLAFVLLENGLASNSNQRVAKTKWGIVVVVTKESHCLTTRM